MSKIQKLLANGSTNYKLNKSNVAGKGYITYGLSLAPGNTSGREVCPNRSPGCSESCLYTSGMGQIHTVQKARIARTKYFFEDRKGFLSQLHKELGNAQKKAESLNSKLAVRLNVLSDIMWEKIDASLFKNYPNIQHYDYSKNYKRMLKFLNGSFPANYNLTFSRSEINDKESLDVLKKGGNVAVVFEKELPKKWNGYEVIDGTSNDMRWLDPKNIVVGLLALGKAKKDKTGFVVTSRVPLKMVA